MVADQALERSEDVLGAALDDGRAGGFERKRDDFRHLAGIGAFRAEPGMQHPGGEQRADQLRLIPRLQPAARSAERFAEESGEAAQATPPSLARHELKHRARPERAAKEREKKRCVGADAADIGVEAHAIAGCELVECRDVGLAIHGEDCMAPVGQQHRGRRRRMRKG